jgi:Uma2 family endonuclease
MALAKAKAISLDDLLRLGSDAQVEVIDGEMLLMSPVGVLHHIIVSNILRVLYAYMTMHEIGSVFPDGLLYLMHGQPKRLKDSFVPDLSFVRNDNFPTNWDISKPHPGAPNLAVEVVSPGDDANKLQTKVRTYLDKGTEQVWVVYPETREVYQYRVEGTPELVRIYREHETMDVEGLFPELVLSLDMVFELPSWAKN